MDKRQAGHGVIADAHVMHTPVHTSNLTMHESEWSRLVKVRKAFLLAASDQGRAA
jgi:hypothetical protein